jgi:entericidin B
MKRKAALIFVLAACTFVSACNTVAGIGKDVERGGEKVQETAKEVQKKL